MGDSELINRQRIVTRSLAVWLLLMVAEIVHGILRAILLVPMVGPFRSNQIGVVPGSAIILMIAFFTIRWIGARQTTELLGVGCLWLVLTVAFEVLFGRLVIGLSWERLGADYNIAQGGLMPLGLAVMFFSPMSAARMRGKRRFLPQRDNEKPG